MTVNSLVMVPSGPPDVKVGFELRYSGDVPWLAIYAAK